MQGIEHGDAVVVAVDAADCAGLWKTVEPWIAKGKRRVVLDFAQVGFINSVNIAQIIALRHRLLPSGVELRVAGLRENIRAVFRILRLERMFSLDQDVVAACAS